MAPQPTMQILVVLPAPSPGTRHSESHTLLTATSSGSIGG